MKAMWASQPTEGSDVLGRRLQDLLDRLVARKGIKHAVVAVERGDRSFRWIGTAGEANPDGEPMRADTPFFIASVTKLHIASVILKLHERDRLGLDEPIATYLPRTLIAGLHQLGGIDYTNTITVRHLLGHTSGLADCLEDRPRGGRSMMERLFHEGDMSWSIDELARIVRDELTPHFPPQPAEAQRQKARYSETNYQLLIAIIEAVAAQPLHEVFEQMLFGPLDLRRTYLPGRSQPFEPTPRQATLWLDNQPLNVPLAIRSSGDLYSTADDTLAFLRALIRGELFDDPATLSLMQQRWNRFSFSLNPAQRSPSWPIEYGLGMMRFRLPRVLTPLHAMPAVVGHTGSTGSWLFHCPQLDLLLSGTVDQVTAGAVPYRFVPKLLRVLGSIPH